MADLTARVLAAALAPATDEALVIMQLSLADWLAVGKAGQGEVVAGLVRGLVLDEGGRPQAALWGGGRAPARAAALVNGTISHALDYDDTHFAHIGHPSVAVIPAALAVAELTGAGKTAFLAAALAGCEAAVRFGLAFGRGHYQVGFHQTATAGAFGATVAAMQLLSAGETGAMRQALGLVSTRAAGLKSQFGTMGKPYNAGLAAAGGVEAALLAARGFVSDPGAIDGPLGFLATHQTDGTTDQPNGFLMTGVSHKYHACCHGLHAALEALEQLKPVASGDVEDIRVATHPRWMSVCNKPAPRTGLEAKFSYRAVMALSVLGHATAALTSFDDLLVVAPDVVQLREKVSVEADANLPETAARVTLIEGGRLREATHDLAWPVPAEQRAAKLRAKIDALHGPEGGRDIWQAVHGDAEDIRALTSLMGSQSGPG